MTLLDSSALVALLLEEPAAAEVDDLLRSGEARISSVNLAETLDVLVRVFRNEIEDVEGRLVPLLVDAVEVIELDEAMARRGAEIRIGYYNPRDMELSLADCLLVGTAAETSDSIATSDGPLAEVVRREGIELVALPDSFGHRP